MLANSSKTYSNQPQNGSEVQNGEVNLKPSPAPMNFASPDFFQSPANILQLQSIIGNRGVTELLKCRLQQESGNKQIASTHNGSMQSSNKSLMSDNSSKIIQCKLEAVQDEKDIFFDDKINEKVKLLYKDKDGDDEVWVIQNLSDKQIRIYNPTKDSYKEDKDFFDKSWRKWSSNKEEAKEVKGVPPSTAEIPDTLYHMTSIENIPGIKKDGLSKDFAGKSCGVSGEGGGSMQYRKRDAALKAVYFGVEKEIAYSMMNTAEDLLEENEIDLDEKISDIKKIPKDFKQVSLIVRPDKATIFRNVRPAKDVIVKSFDQENSTQESKTVLSFESFEPDSIWLVMPDESEKLLKDVTEKEIENIKEIILSEYELWRNKPKKYRKNSEDFKDYEDASKTHKKGDTRPIYEYPYAREKYKKE